MYKEDEFQVLWAYTCTSLCFQVTNFFDANGNFYWPSWNILVNTSAPSSISVCAGVLMSESARFNLVRWSHVKATAIGCRGRSLVIFFSMYASTPTFSVSSSMPDTWNHTEPREHVSTLTIAFLFQRGRRRSCASLSWMNERRTLDGFWALAIVLWRTIEHIVCVSNAYIYTVALSFMGSVHGRAVKQVAQS